MAGSDQSCDLIESLDQTALVAPRSPELGDEVQADSGSFCQVLPPRPLVTSLFATATMYPA